MDGNTVLYVCDPEKNTGCGKQFCRYLLKPEDGGICDVTFWREFAKKDSDGNPLIHRNNAKWQARKREKERAKKNV